MPNLVSVVLKLFPREKLIQYSTHLLPITKRVFSGNRYLDPIDGKGYRTFLPYGYQKSRKNALSPGTLSLERHRIMWLYLLKETDFFSSNLKVLHIAPEQCFYPRFKSMQNIEYFTMDLSSPLADVHADICDIPFENDFFDVIFCNHVLEHVLDDRQAMKELYRILKPGGWGILQIPIDLNLEKTDEDFTITDPKIRAERFGQYDHVRQYGMDYKKRLQQAGFDVKLLKYQEKFSPEECKLMGLSNSEVLPIVHKM